MNKYTYSASVNAFFPLALRPNYDNSKSWPDDAINISDEMADIFMSEPPEGKIRVPGNDGLPAWGEIPAPTHEEMIASAEQERQRLLTHADTIMYDWRTELMLGEISDANREKLSAWLAYKNDVKSFDVTTDPGNISWPAQPL